MNAFAACWTTAQENKDIVSESAESSQFFTSIAHEPGLEILYFDWLNLKQGQHSEDCPALSTQKKNNGLTAWCCWNPLKLCSKYGDTPSPPNPMP